MLLLIFEKLKILISACIKFDKISEFEHLRYFKNDDFIAQIILVSEIEV